MLTKTLVLPTDLFTGGFCPVEVAGLMEGKMPELPLFSRPERTGELRLLAGGEGVEAELDEAVLTKGTTGVLDGEEDVEDCEFPPSWKPLPLNGIMFLMSCDPEPLVVVEGFPFPGAFFSELFPSFLPFLPYPSGSLTLV